MNHRIFICNFNLKTTHAATVDMKYVAKECAVKCSNYASGDDMITSLVDCCDTDGCNFATKLQIEKKFLLVCFVLFFVLFNL